MPVGSLQKKGRRNRALHNEVQFVRRSGDPNPPARSSEVGGGDVTEQPAADRPARAFRVDLHPRSFADNRYVYAVLSRRARGLSIGINLSPDKACNFNCVYCQVDRTVPPSFDSVDEARLLSELEVMLGAAARGELVEQARRDGVAEPLCRIADIAFSGDGEPTAYPRLLELLSETGRRIDALLPGTAVTLITNAALFHLPRVRRVLDLLAARAGNVWAKLDAGTEGYFRQVNRSGAPFYRVLDNIREEARRHPIVIQSLFLRFGEQAPDTEEIEAWCARLAGIQAAGGKLQAIQVTTVARRPAVPEVSSLAPEELEAIARLARAAVPGVPVDVFPANTPGTTLRPQPRETEQ